MLIYTFYTLVISAVIFVVGGILFLLPTRALAYLSEWANKVLLVTDQKITPFRKGMGIIFLFIGLWFFYRLFLLLKTHPTLVM